MAHTYSSMLFHVVWSTLKRQPLITEALKFRLHGYIRRVIEDREAKLVVINGMPDHVHALIGIKPTMALATLMRDIKTTSSKWVRLNFPEQRDFSWQDGYGAFSVGLSALPIVKNYILNQEQHHSKKTFENEFIDFLRAHQMTYEERYVFD